MGLLTTSKDAREILERLRRTGVRPNLWARAALGYSLSLAESPDQADYDSEGTEFQEPVFFGDDRSVLLALLRQRAGKAVPAAEVGSLIKLHVERGLRHFSEEYERLNRRGDELLLSLVSCGGGDFQTRAATSIQLVEPPPKGTRFKVVLSIGKAPGTSREIKYVLNAPGTAPHVAIMGRNGTGKTRTAISFLTQMASERVCRVPFLIFDYAKGDIADNTGFVRATGASLVSLPNDVLALAPLALGQRDEHSVSFAAHRFRDTIAAVVRGLGPKQKSRCLQIIREAYEQQEGGTPDLEHVVAAAERQYHDNDWPEDSLLACLREFTDFPLFRPAAEGVDHDFFRASHVIDIHDLPEDLRKLTVFLMLDRLYWDIMALPDAPLDSENNRQLRLIIAIDEAHHYLPCKQATLEKMVREVRSKGVAIWLMSQSPDDFDQPSYNFAREMGLAIVFSCVLEKPKMLEAVLGGKINPKKLSQLPAGVALTRIPDSSEPLEVEAWRP